MFERADFARYTKHSKLRRANQSGHGLLCDMSDQQVAIPTMAVNLIRVMIIMLTIDPPLVDTVADEVNSE